MDNNSRPAENPSLRPRFILSVAVICIIVGCFTLAVIFGALFGGLWLDRRMGTKPIATILLVIGSAPIALGIIYYFVAKEIPRLGIIEPRQGNKNSGMTVKEDNPRE